MAASADRQLQFEGLGGMNDLPVLENTVIYGRTFVGHSGGYARPLTAGDDFLGISEGQVNNNPTGGAASGARNVRIYEKGFVQHAVTGVDGVDDIGAIVYASDDQTLTLTSTSNTAIGRVARHITSTTCVVYFQSKYLQDQA